MFLFSVLLPLHSFLSSHCLVHLFLSPSASTTLFYILLNSIISILKPTSPRSAYQGSAFGLYYPIYISVLEYHFSSYNDGCPRSRDLNVRTASTRTSASPNRRVVVHHLQLSQSHSSYHVLSKSLAQPWSWNVHSSASDESINQPRG